jgi:hypothetical protein
MSAFRSTGQSVSGTVTDMTDFDADVGLLYLVGISRPGDFGPAWWQVGNTGTPAQVAGALIELATRAERDLPSVTADGAAGRCRFRYEVCWPDGVVLASFEGTRESVLIPGELRGLAMTIRSVSMPDTGHRS